MEIFPQEQPGNGDNHQVIIVVPVGAAMSEGPFLSRLCVHRSVGRVWWWCGTAGWWVSIARGRSSTRARRLSSSTEALWSAASCISPGGRVRPASRWSSMVRRRGTRAAARRGATSRPQPRQNLSRSPLSSGSQPDFLLARRPRGQRPEVALRGGGGQAGRHGDRGAQVQRSYPSVRAAAAPRPRPRAVHIRDLQRL